MNAVDQRNSNVRFWVIFTLSNLFILLSSARAAEEVKPVDLIDQKTADHGFVLIAASKSDFPVTVVLDLQLDNLSSSVKTPVTMLVPPHKRMLLARLGRLDARKPSQYKTEWTYFWGWRSDAPDDSPYILPYPAGYAYQISQGFNGTFSHQGRNALDFALPEGSTICAARGGVVVEVEQSYTEGGISEDFKTKANRVIILQDDGATARYAHLKHDGALVRVGQRVDAGEKIALSGATGYAKGPHLHFEVDRPPASGNDYESIAMQFFARRDDGTIAKISPNERDLLMRPFDKDPGGAKLPVNAIDNLVTCRRIEHDYPTDRTNSFTARDPMYAALRANLPGKHELLVKVTREKSAPGDQPLFLGKVSDADQVGLLVLTFDLPGKHAAIRGKCLLHILVDGQELATAAFYVGS